MAKLTGPELVKLAAASGFSQTKKTRGVSHDRWAAAIALAESDGDPRAHNTTPPDNSYGLMQINMFGALGPSRRSAFGIKNNDALFDPFVNMVVAYQVYRDADSTFTPWSTYPGRASLKLPKTGGVSIDERKDAFRSGVGAFTEVDKAVQRASRLGMEAIGLSGKAVAEGLVDFADPIGALIDWLEGIGLRIAAFVGGGLLLLVGLMVLFGRARSVGSAAKTVSKGGS